MQVTAPHVSAQTPSSALLEKNGVDGDLFGPGSVQATMPTATGTKPHGEQIVQAEAVAVRDGNSTPAIGAQRRRC
jgi:hypothetical protein